MRKINPRFKNTDFDSLSVYFEHTGNFVLHTSLLKKYLCPLLAKSRSFFIIKGSFQSHGW
jgi:hypothetical protein